MKISIIIPCYNEIKRVGHLEAGIINFISKPHPYSYEFILVNDGSKDDTFNLLKNIAKHSPHIQAVGYEKNRGKGYALRQGFLHAQGDYSCIMDADLATSLDEIDKTYFYLSAKDDFIMGDRYANVEGAYHSGFFRKAASGLFSLFGSLPLTHKYRDTQAGYKFYPRKFYHYISKVSREEGFNFDVEHIMIAEMLNLNIRAYPISEWINGEDSKVRIWRDGMRMSISCIKLFLKKRSPSYLKELIRLSYIEEESPEIIQIQEKQAS